MKLASDGLHWTSTGREFHPVGETKKTVPVARHAPIHKRHQKGTITFLNKNSSGDER